MKAMIKMYFFLFFLIIPFCNFGMNEEFKKEAFDKSEKICELIMETVNKVEQAWERAEEEYRKKKFRLNVEFYSSVAALIGVTAWYIKKKINQISLENDRYKLLTAIFDNNDDKVRKFAYKVTTMHKVSLDEQYNNKYFLNYAIRWGGYECVKVLLENKANPNLRDKKNKTALYTAVHKAIKQGNSLYLVQLLLDYGADCRNIDGQGNNIFHRAALEAPALCHKFLDLKRSLEKENKFIETFLLCMKDKDKILRFKFPKPLLLEILSYAEISNIPYSRNSIAYMGLLFEKNKDNKTPYDILAEKHSLNAEEFNPSHLELKYVPKNQYIPLKFSIDFYPKIKSVD